jgi:hypothetical protein
MAYAFRCGVARHKQRADVGGRVLMAHASEFNSIWSVIVPADGTRTATVGERRLRYFAAFVGQLSDKPLLASIWLCGGVGRKEQWRIEKLRADLIR